MTQPELEEKQKTLDPVKIEHDQTHTHTTREQKRQKQKTKKRNRGRRKKQDTSAAGWKRKTEHNRDETNTKKTVKTEHDPKAVGIGEVAGADLSLVIRRLTASSSHHHRRLVYIMKGKVWI
jgi:sRNA-binding protein